MQRVGQGARRRPVRLRWGAASRLRPGPAGEEGEELEVLSGAGLGAGPRAELRSLALIPRLWEAVAQIRPVCATLLGGGGGWAWQGDFPGTGRWSLISWAGGQGSEGRNLRASRTAADKAL